MSFYYVDIDRIPPYAFDAWIRVIPNYERLTYKPNVRDKFLVLLESAWGELDDHQKINSTTLLSSWLFSNDAAVRSRLLSLPIEKDWIIQAAFSLAEDNDQLFRWFNLMDIQASDIGAWMEKADAGYSLFLNPAVMEYVSDLENEKAKQRYFENVAHRLKHNNGSISAFFKYANQDAMEYLISNVLKPDENNDSFVKELMHTMYNSALRRNVNIETDRNQYLNICYLADHIFAEYSHLFKRNPQALGLKMTISTEWDQEYPTLKSEYMQLLAHSDTMASIERFALLKSIPEVWPYFNEDERVHVRSFFETYLDKYSKEFLESDMSSVETLGFLGSMNSELIDMGIRVFEKNTMYNLGVHRISDKIVCRWWEQHRLGADFTPHQRKALEKYMNVMFNENNATAAISGRIQAAYASSPDIMLFWQEQPAWKRFVQRGDFLTLMHKKELWYMNAYNKSLINRCMDELFGDDLPIDFADTYVEYMEKAQFRELDDIRKISVVLFGEESLIYFDLQRSDTNELAWSDFYAYAKTRLSIANAGHGKMDLGAVYVQGV